MANPHMIIKDKQILFVGEYMEAYLEAKFFKKGLNEIYGDQLKILGIFNYRLGKDGTIPANAPLKTFKFPSIMYTEPNSMEDAELELIPGTGVKKYKLLKYYKNAKVMTDTRCVATIDSVSLFNNIKMAGGIPNTIKYLDIEKLDLANLEINKQNLGTPATQLSIAIAEIYRYKGDISIPFRKKFGKGEAGDLDYIAGNSRMVCAANSTVAALTFEDQDSMLVSSINRKRYKKKQNPSPLEAIIRV